ncbi:hypothetical protein GCM10007938_13430 [Vibrio zhanjiangensis]|uniref:Outer membrane protein beta-barrel domain-containing protein n=1 Tax=Vibrio zhanjiangensis TaxID=1046128 RepID=A0ABQ6EY89_9VIBR|nr:outer membrane beta-barrel protein [Vibrio zhanjiangensis]GLT17565.1 hypothetical protein GCM10007938_13430 [Vibrio zhanjiangensis]
MQNKTVKLFALGALAVATTFAASAENTYDYFVGFDAGTHVDGEFEYKAEGYSATLVENNSPIIGLSGGAIINDHHRVKFGLAYDALTIADSTDDETYSRMDMTASYDFMLPIANRLNWTVGAHMGYEFFESDADNLNGFTYGVQTGLDYKLTRDWSLGTEVAYTEHEKDEWGTSSLQIDNDVILTANVQYHF